MHNRSADLNKACAKQKNLNNISRQSNTHLTPRNGNIHSLGDTGDTAERNRLDFPASVPAM
jgi:hypothetical protein